MELILEEAIAKLPGAALRTSFDFDQIMLTEESNPVTAFYLCVC